MACIGEQGTRDNKEPAREWECDQELIITALPTDRIVVDAGPGTGKTAVACARVAHLIDYEGCEPNAIWLISFTRTAVAELRQRIATFMEDPDDAHSVRIATLDAHAWSLHSGFNPEARLDGGYDSNIVEFTEQLREDPELQQYISSIRHLIIDEAQDIVGIRADLVEEILGHLDPDCGVTIFSDRAQSIYGFSSDGVVDQGSGSDALLERLGKTGDEQAFDHLSLSQVFRTNSESLLKIFSSVRQRVLAQAEDSEQKLREVSETIKRLANGTPDEEFSDELRERDDLLILYRRRGEALLASSQLRERGVPHRLRMSGLPICIHPWLARCLAGHVEPTLSRQQFSKRWSAVAVGEGIDEETAWALLVRFGGKTTSLVDMSRLTSVLGRAKPPAEFSMPDLGTAGPIVGTIHASKGREAPTVHLMIPPARTSSDRDNLDEETRVIFVGATRAKTELLVGEGDKRSYQKLDGSERTFRRLAPSGGYTRAQVEIGHDGDIDATGVAGRTRFPHADDVQHSQSRLAALSHPLSVRASMEYDNQWAYGVVPESGDLTPLAYLSNQVNADLFSIGERVLGKSAARKIRPPNRILHLSVVGTRSLVVTPDASIREALHYPWSASGIMLAPVVVGFAVVNFQYRKYSGNKF